MSMKVLVGAIGHESNTFTPFLTTQEDFYIQEGTKILDRPFRSSSLEGIIHTFKSSNMELVPSILARAMPGGVVERAVYHRFKRILLESAHSVDGVCLFLHGAMRAEGYDYCENDLLRDLRATVGPDIPVSIALDMHANIVSEMVETVDAMVAYHTAPHIDAYETGVRAAEMLLRILKDNIEPKIGFTKIPFLLPGEMAQTERDPMKSMMRMVEDLEETPDVLSASLAVGHCWADIPDTGITALVVTAGDAGLAQAEANNLASTFWERRKEFGVSAEAYPVEEAIHQAMGTEESTVFLSDSGDNPGAGGTTDVPLVLEKLLARGADNVLIAGIWDVETVEACVSAGVGNELTCFIGGKLDKRHGTPLKVTGKVKDLIDGDSALEGVRQLTTHAETGTIAILAIEGVEVILSSSRLSFEDPAQLRALGLEPLNYRIVVLKRGYLTAPFQAISQRSILAFSPGATNCDVTKMEFNRVNRPIYPLDPDMTWTL
jgi:microcystin degradation protein MlrC